MPTIARTTCEICGYHQMYHKEDPASKPKKCSRCGNFYGQGKFVSAVNPNASPASHNLVRWGCRACKHYGVSWLVKRKKYLEKCPNCGESRSAGHLMCERTNSHGDCKTIWKPIEGRTRPVIRTNLPKKRFQCSNCGYIQRYLVRPKQPCPRCDLSTEVQHA